MDALKKKLNEIRFSETRRIKAIQNINFSSYLDSICSQKSLQLELFKCQEGVTESLREENILQVNNCNLIESDLHSCKILHFQLWKVFEIRQQKYFNENFLRLHSLSGIIGI